MSEKFGLDWVKYPADRIQYFIAILNADYKRSKINARKNKPKRK